MDSSDEGVPTWGNADEVWKLGTQLIYRVSQVQVAQQWRRLYEGRGRRRSVEARFWNKPGVQVYLPGGGGRGFCCTTY
ncbi:unnamed protein product [Prunus armeniaca]